MTNMKWAPAALGAAEIAILVAPAIALAEERHEGHASTAAAGGHEEGHHSAPGWDVGLQAINFCLFALLIVWIARHRVREFFQGRESSYRAALVKARAAKEEAEGKRREMQERLAKLEATANQALEQARTEANDLMARMTSETDALRKTLRADAERTLQIELDRAKAELREEMIAHAFAIAKKTLSEKIADTDQLRLQTEFVEKIQVVRP